MIDIIIFTRADGGLSTYTPTGEKSLTEMVAFVTSGALGPATNIRQATTADIPPNRNYRNAWEDVTTHVDVNMPKAKLIAHERRRMKREEVFKPHMEITSKAAQGIPLKAGESAVAAQTAMNTYKTTIDDVAQVAIDAALTWQEIEAAEIAAGIL